ncbi:N-acetyldiaminopimelate deacetylase [Bacillus testis]|uniref:N-acetyldiaminopimelate deacetylase n=1 Tax=Bacillus testis TaxID=1622072 RepID=UPI000B096E58|nr:N-acetyldiaminopimelate deacetylase [Bacillus testis]
MKDSNEFIGVRRELHAIPELGFEEYKTQAFLLNYLESLPAGRLSICKWKTGLFVKVFGRSPVRTIGYRTDIDGLPITEQTGLPFQSQHSGRMHACGHDVHMAIALGVLTRLVHEPIDDDALFIFQPAEEGPGGAEPMLKSDIMAEWRPDMMIGLHIAPEYPVGTIATKKGLLFANTSELYIDIKGKGGHAAYPHQTNDTIIAVCQLVGQLQSIISRNVDPLDSAVITIGKITGGTVQNIIAEHSRIEGTIRTLSPESMAKVKQRIEELVRGIEVGFACETAIDYGCMYYQVNNEETLTDEFIAFAEQEPGIDFQLAKTGMTGEDFGYMLKEIPGFMFWLGVESPYGLHHAKLNPQEEAIPKAIDFLASYMRYKGNRG